MRLCKNYIHWLEILIYMVSQAGFEPLSVVTSLESIELGMYDIDL